MHDSACVGVEVGLRVRRSAAPARQHENGAVLRERAVATLPGEDVIGQQGGIVVAFNTLAKVDHRGSKHELLGADAIDRRSPLGEMRRRVNVRAAVLVERPSSDEEAICLPVEAIGDPHGVIQGRAETLAIGDRSDR